MYLADHNTFTMQVWPLLIKRETSNVSFCNQRYTGKECPTCKRQFSQLKLLLIIYPNRLFSQWKTVAATSSCGIVFLQQEQVAEASRMRQRFTSHKDDDPKHRRLFKSVYVWFSQSPELNITVQRI